MAGTYGIIGQRQISPLLTTRLWIAGIASLVIHSLVIFSAIPTRPWLGQPAEPPGTIQLALPATPHRSPEFHQTRRSHAAPPKPARSAVEKYGQGVGPLLRRGLPTDETLRGLEDEIYPPDQVDIRPQINRIEFPDIPVSLPASERVFRIRIVIGPDGTPELFESLDPKPLPAELIELTQRAVRNAEFLPAYIANRPVRSWLSLELQLLGD